MIALDIEGLCRLADDDRLLRVLCRLNRGHRLRLRSCGYRTEVLLHDRHGRRRLHIAGNRDHNVRWRVVALVEGRGLCRVDLRQLRLPANARSSIRMRDIRGREKLLHHAPDGIGVGAHAPLFHHHVALFVELARHRMTDAAALHIRPELEPVCRHAPEIFRGIQGGGGIDAGRTVLLGNLRELVGNYVLLRILLRRVEGLTQLLQLRGILSHALTVLSVVGGIRVFHLLQRHLLGRPVRGADLLRAFEGQVLEHVGNAGLTGRIVRVARVHQRVVRENRRLRPLDEQNRQAVGKNLRGDTLFKAGKFLLRQIGRCRGLRRAALCDGGQQASTGNQGAGHQERCRPVSHPVRLGRVTLGQQVPPHPLEKRVARHM